MLLRHIFFLLLTVLTVLAVLSAPAQAQVLTPTKLTASLSQPTAAAGTELDLIIQAQIQPKWQLYASDFDPNVGPAVFTLTFAKDLAYVLVGKPKSVGSTKHYDDVFKGNVTYFEKTGRITQRIRVLRPGPLTVKAEADYQSCSDADGRCVPGTTSLTFGPLIVGPKASAPAVRPAPVKRAKPTSALWQRVPLAFALPFTLFAIFPS